MNILQGEHSGPWQVEPIIMKAQAQLTHFKKISVAHCSRSENPVAYFVANAQRSGLTFAFWVIKSGIYFVLMPSLWACLLRTLEVE